MKSQEMVVLRSRMRWPLKQGSELLHPNRPRNQSPAQKYKRIVETGETTSPSSWRSSEIIGETMFLSVTRAAAWFLIAEEAL